MNSPVTVSARAILVSIVLIVTACGGGGGGGSTNVTLPNDNQVTSGEVTTENGKMLSFEQDIEPIMQGKCLGCHNSGDNPLAPFSLEGSARVQSFKSAILFTLESGIMPPVDVQQLTQSERAKLIAWLNDRPYGASGEVLRIALVEPEAWDVQPKNRDTQLEHRPGEVDCPRDTGWLVEEDALEVRTEFCNYLSVSQQSLLDLEAGIALELVLSHSALNFNAPATAHMAVSIGGNPLWETTVEIPSESDLIKQELTLPFAVQRGDTIEVHLHNHGDNTWTFHSLDAFVPADQELTFCPSFDSTFEAIQAVVFEQAGCASSLCHGEAKAGDLDLTTLAAYDSIVTVPSKGSSLALVEPRKPSRSYLYHKLSAKTFPGSYAVDGSPMPSAGAGISAGQLEAIRLWIEAGSPREGSVGDTLGRGEDELERLLGVCLPEAEPVNTTPLPPPTPDKGVQFSMPEHAVLAEKERELCFAVYEDFRNVIPPEYLDATGDNFYIKSGEVREDAFTHHNLIYQAPVGVDQIHHPDFGEWTCGGGANDGQICEPTDLSSCGEQGKCRSEVQDSVACQGYGPPYDGEDRTILGLGTGIEKEGFYQTFPAHGLFYWNSHAFNLTTEDGILHVWRNIYFADDRRFRATRINEIKHIIAATGTPPFEKKTVCRDYLFEQGDGLLAITSHTHKRGERFFMSIKETGEEVYETFTYDEPLYKRFEPAVVFNSSDPAKRTLEFCATYNNGVNDDGSPNIETVTRLSRRPTNAGACRPTACVAGNVGGSCKGKDDDASCDSSPGADDGWCDACIIMPGVSSDDEMFILLGSRLKDHDALLGAPALSPEVAFASPSEGEVFSAGDTINLDFDFKHFELMPPKDHNHDDASEHDSDGTGHSDAEGDHDSVTSGHYHIYLDTNDDSADHITAWSESLEFVLPAGLEPGSHVIRISLRAPDHHPIGVESSVRVEVQ
jgi:hypothetical protein